MSFLCSIRGHKRDRRSAWHDTLDWRSNCARCGAPMLKDSISGEWRVFNPETDFSLDRTGKPTSG